jgi:hypothetical protein
LLPEKQPEISAGIAQAGSNAIDGEQERAHQSCFSLVARISDAI